MSFEALKRSRGNFDKLTKELEVLNKPATSQNSSKDERFWRPELDKSGNGYAVIRFLPAVEGEELPWARVWSHAFQGPGGWYIENSLTTMNKKDPVSEENSKLWNSGVESDKEIARKRKRKLTYYTNIMVVADPKNPENEGQIKLFKFGKKIFDKITEAMQPAFEDEKPLNPFDFWEGANFKLKIRKVDGYWNYDKSEFEPVSRLKPTDEEIDKIWKSQYALKAFIDPSNFKSYDELKEKLNKVLTGTRSTESVEDIDLPPVSNDLPKSSNGAVEKEETSNDGDDLSYFSKLAEDDS